MNDVAKSYFVKRSLIGYSINCKPMKSFLMQNFGIMRLNLEKKL